MKNHRDYYQVLHVGRDAPAAVIRASYRALMQELKVHPDLGGNHAQAVLLNEAYATLSDPARRATYDRTLARQSGPRRASAPASRREPAPPGRTAPHAAPFASPPRDAAARAAACCFCAAPHHPARASQADSTCDTCQSPLAPAPTHRGGDAARRAVARVPRNMPVRFRVSTSRHAVHRGTTEDLSLNGIRLLSPVQVAVGDRVQVDCAFCVAVAVVRSVRAGQRAEGTVWRCGLEFVTLRLIHQRGGLVSTVA